MKFLKPLIMLVILAAIGAGMWAYWHHSTLYPSTRDAFVQANVVTIAAEVTGKVVAVHVRDNQQVDVGDPLFDIDDTVYRNAVTQAKATLSSLDDAEDSYEQQVQAATTVIDSETSARDTMKAQMARMQNLFDDGDVAEAAMDSARTDAVTARSKLRAAEAALSEARTALAGHRNEIISAEAALRTAQVNLERSKVTSPVSGWVANLTLREGSVVTAYQPLFSMVDSTEWWVDANFKETDLPRITQSQTASFTVDMLPGATFTGRVGSIARGSGATFALLPAENASGNWVKVTQRFPVRILLTAPDPRLRVGASATVTVDTTGAVE